MTPKKTFVLLNPVAGTTPAEQVAAQIRQVCEANQIPYKIHTTAKDEDLKTVVTSALEAGFERFLAAGGDGTVSGLANALDGTGIPVIIIPTGTVNSLAKVLDIPFELEEAAGWWLNRTQIKAIDAMVVEDRYYLLNISAGVSSLAIKSVRRKEKRLLGSLAYMLRGLERLVQPSIYHFHFDIDGQLFVHCRARELLVANTGVLQVKDLPASPDFSIDDGKVSVCYFKVRNIWEFAWFVIRIVLGRQRRPPELVCKEAAEEIWIRTNRPIPVQADGDIIGETPVSIRLAPGAVDFLIPEPEVD